MSASSAVAAWTCSQEIGCVEVRARTSESCRMVSMSSELSRLSMSEMPESREVGAVASG